MVNSIFLLLLAGMVLLFTFTACGDPSIEPVPSTESSLETPSDMAGSNGNTLSSELGGESEEGPEEETEKGEKAMNLQLGEKTLKAALVDNTSTQALLELLADGPLTIEMEDYANMEKVGDIGVSLPRNDEPITTQAGDLILYQGKSFVIYYAPNTWTFTRLGRIEGVTGGELQTLLGDGAVTVTLSLE